ncbi:HAMP domain-containing sensor histidine kinase [Bdellovibrio sp. 22V]|uniref:sensor histidine kinase n=1 Tax=Bdellovibrio TaxID=958 RepID=UPI00254393E7|nr:HAMP domain-containing sensor histidine kinase [Bdellovibrio sp. 22V]WII72434.1 HAMP domain-containing sensor histidine kinase [Bdellovibrio sp. 22V]
MFQNLLKPKVKTALAIIWFAFTFSLVAWWWVFFLIKFSPSNSTHRMFAWEGTILLAAILLGGIALIVFSYRDQKRHQRLRFFFSTFSHDIKTSITRLRLQAEVLEEDLPNYNNPVMKRLIQDIQRLDLQLENSLLLANLEVGELLQENISLNNLFSSLRNEFTELSLELEREVIVRGDRRALLSVFKNLLQNSVLHGKASTVRIKVRPLKGHRIELVVQDNGLGFKGALEKLGSEILMSQDSRSNGIGLLLTKRLLQKMKGDIRFESIENDGFASYLELEGYLP